MTSPRPHSIRIANFDNVELTLVNFDVGPTGSYATRVGMFEEGELFIDIHQKDVHKFQRIIFDHVTTDKIQRMLRRRE